MADLAAQRQIPAPGPQSSKSGIIRRCDLPSPTLRLYSPSSVNLFSQSTARLASSSSNKLPCLKAPMYLFQRPFSNLQPTWLWGRGYLEVDFDTVDLFPQDLVRADVLRECPQSRDAELRAADSFNAGESIQGRFQGDPQVSFVFFAVLSVANDFTCG